MSHVRFFTFYSLVTLLKYCAKITKNKDFISRKSCMSPILFHIYGPIAVHSFGLMIAVALTVTLYFLHKDQKIRAIVSCDELATIFQIGFFSGIIGGRAWFLITHADIIEHWSDILSVWYGGLSVLGAIIAIISSLSVYFYIKNFPVLRILDQIIVYGPLTQSISRFGCFFAGCCHGQPTQAAWAVTYTNPQSLAPLHIALHPTQIYSSVVLCGIFFLLFYFNRKHQRFAGQTLGLYLICMSTERFVLDFLRGDQEYIFTSSPLYYLTAQQLLSLVLFFVGCMIFFHHAIVTYYKKIVS